jgi:hypothetical protein
LRPRTKALLTAVTIVGFAIVSLAKTQKMSGKMVGYDLMKHNSKSTSVMQNQEVVVLETSSPKPKDKYVKVMFSSFGTTQIEQKYFDGAQPLEVDVLRDKSCDDKSPRFASQVSADQIAGFYLLTDAFKTHPPATIKHLECYVAIEKKKK